MKQKIQQWRDRFEALSVRERAIIVIALLGGIYTTWNLALMKPLHKQQSVTLSDISRWQNQIKDINSKITMISDGMTGSGESGSLLRIKNLKDEISKINQIKKDITVGFIRPEQMADVLKGLLKKEPGLKLVRLQSLAVSPLFPPEVTQDKKGKSTGKATGKTAAMSSKPQDSAGKTDVVNNAPAKPEIYKHGVVLEFQGDYLSTVKYLQSLEALPWKFYWDGMAYKVQEYPKAQVTVNVFTLSLEKGWIGV